MRARITNNWNHKVIWYQKEWIDKTNNGENVTSLELIEVVLVQCNLEENQYWKKSEVNTFTSNKSCAFLLNVEPSSFVFLKAYNTELSKAQLMLKK